MNDLFSAFVARIRNNHAGFDSIVNSAIVRISRTFAASVGIDLFNGENPELPFSDDDMDEIRGVVVADIMAKLHTYNPEISLPSTWINSLALYTVRNWIERQYSEQIGNLQLTEQSDRDGVSFGQGQDRILAKFGKFVVDADTLADKDTRTKFVQIMRTIPIKDRQILRKWSKGERQSEIGKTRAYEILNDWLPGRSDCRTA